MIFFMAYFLTRLKVRLGYDYFSMMNFKTTFYNTENILVGLNHTSMKATRWTWLESLRDHSWMYVWICIVGSLTMWVLRFLDFLACNRRSNSTLNWSFFYKNVFFYICTKDKTNWLRWQFSIYPSKINDVDKYLALE